MKKFFRFAAFFLIFFFITMSRVYAESNYVLPYPSSMPGSIFYKIDVLKEKILEYWYFGNFGKFGKQSYISLKLYYGFTILG